MKDQCLGSTLRPWWGSPAIPRALAKEAISASPSPSQLAMQAEFTVSAVLRVSTTDGKSTQKGKHVFSTSIHSHFEWEKGTTFLLNDRQGSAGVGQELGGCPGSCR